MHAAIFGMGPLEFVIVASVVLVLFFPTVLSRLIRRFSQTAGALRDMADEQFDSGDDDGD